MLGYNLLTEFFSDDRNKKGQVYMAQTGSLYKVVFAKDAVEGKNADLTMFKFYTNQQQAEDAAEDWVRE